MEQPDLTELLPLLQQQDVKVTCAESCTGGLLASILTDKPGSSKWFDMGFVTYSNDAKHQLLGVSLQTLAQFGAVSVETAREMASGAQKRANADFALSVTGIAGPDGGSKEKPVGTVCFGFATKDQVDSFQIYFKGTRSEIRLSSVTFCLNLLLNALSKKTHP